METCGRERQGGCAMRSALLNPLVLSLAFLGPACAGAPPSEAPLTPPVYALVLGTAQDAGLPQLGCFLSCCSAVREDPSRRRLVTSILISDRDSAKRWLLDCSPDIEEQVVRSQGRPITRDFRSDRPPLFDGIFLTHAHMGHYTGLLELGREAYGSKGQKVYSTERMQRFLVANDPWSYMVETGGIELHQLAPGESVRLSPNIEVTAIPVPHRQEFADTVAFRVTGPNRSLLYLPDIDKWERWNVPIEEVIATVDVALLDGAFFADGEIPGRSMADIPHPFISESLARFASLPEEERAKVLFTHLNHTNPAADPTSAAARSVRKAGMGIAEDGMVIEL